MLKASNGTIYDEFQGAYIGLQIIVIFAFSAYQTLSFCLLPSVYLSVYFVHVSVCASAQLDLHSHWSRNKITDGRASTINTQAPAFKFIF